MAEIVNLRRVKKARIQARAEKDAAANRAKHGQTRDQRETVARHAERENQVLDGAKLSRDGEATE